MNQSIHELNYPCLVKQTGGKRDYEIGDKIRVVCSGFSSKGIPEMSLVDDE